MMGGGILLWLIIGIGLYLLLSRNGSGMGCCGGHNDHQSDAPRHAHRPSGNRGQDDDVVDLKKEDYHVLP